MKKMLFLLMLIMAVVGCKKASSPTSQVSSWTLVAKLNGSYGNQSMQDLTLSDSKTLWAVGYYNFLVKSTDGGTTWHNFVVDPSISNQVAWSCVCFRNPQLGWIVGGNCIYKTTDGGNTWTSVFNMSVSGAIYIPSSVYFLSDTKGFICSHNGTLMRTLDGGATWQNQHLDSFTTLDLYSVTFFDENNGWVIGRNGILFGTTDGGNHWSLLHSSADPAVTPFFGNDCHNIISFGPTELFGINGKVIKSVDGGITWTNDGADIPGSSMLFARSANEWFCGLEGAANTSGSNMGHTTDGGKTWATFNPAGVIMPIRKIFSYGTDVYAFASDMEIVKYNN